MSETYPIKYWIEKGSWTREQLAKEEGEGKPIGACDALLLCSIIKDSGFSALFIGFDGTTGTMMSDVDSFKIWMLLAGKLSESTTLNPWQQSLVKNIKPKVLETLQKINDEEGV